MVDRLSRNLGVVGFLILAVAVSVAFYKSFTISGDIQTTARKAAVAAASARATADKVEAARRERVKQLNIINKAQCASIGNLYGVLAKTVEDSDSRLATIDYYRLHPAEARDVHRQNLETLRKFRKPACPPDIKLAH